MIIVVPDYRHASPPPLADGDTVPVPPRALPAGYQPPHRGRVVATIAVIGGIMLVLMVLGIAGVTS